MVLLQHTFLSYAQNNQVNLLWTDAYKIYELEINIDKPSSLCAAMFYVLKLRLGDAIFEISTFHFYPIRLVSKKRQN